MLRLFSRFLPAIAAMIIVAVFQSCGSAKKSAAPSQSSVYGATEEGSPDTKTLLANYSPNWEKIQLPLTLRLRQPKSISVSGTATFDCGNSLTISLRFPILGEIGVVKLTQDSLLAIDKINRKYIAEPLDGIVSGCPVSAADIQNLLLGRPFLIGSSDPLDRMVGKFDIQPSPTSKPAWLMIPRVQPSAIEYGFSLDELCRLVSVAAKAGPREPVVATYADPVSTAFGVFSSTVSLSATVAKTPLDFSLEWNFSKAKWNADVQPRSISVPKNYSRIPAASLMKLLPSL